MIKDHFPPWVWLNDGGTNDDGRQGHPDNSWSRVVSSGCSSRVTSVSGSASLGLHGGAYTGFTTAHGGPYEGATLVDIPVIPGSDSIPVIQFPDDKDENALLPIENDIKEDCMFLSDDASYQDDIIASMRNETEYLEANNRRQKAYQEHEQIQRNRMITQFDPAYNQDLSKKIEVFAKIDKFTGLVDLDDEQLKYLKAILLQIEPDILRKNLRAADLVKKWITEEEWKELLYSSKITIYSKKHKNRQYVVHADPMKRVEMFNKDRFFASACGVDSIYDMADGDKFLNKVLALKEDEDGYLAKSNVFRA